MWNWKRWPWTRDQRAWDRMVDQAHKEIEWAQERARLWQEIKQYQAELLLTRREARKAIEYVSAQARVRDNNPFIPKSE